MKLRIAHLERLIEHQSEAYVKGYIEAKKESRLLLSDIDIDNLDAKYRASLYKKAFAHFEKMSMV